MKEIGDDKDDDNITTRSWLGKEVRHDNGDGLTTALLLGSLLSFVLLDGKGWNEE